MKPEYTYILSSYSNPNGLNSSEMKLLYYNSFKFSLPTEVMVI